MPVPLKLTHHAFLDTVAGKSTISGKSSGKCCWHNEDHNQEKIGKMHLPLNREQLSQLEDLLHCTTLDGSRNEYVCKRSIRQDGVGCRQDTHCTTSVAALQPNQPTCSLHPRAFETAASASHSFTRTNGALHCSMLEGSRPNYFSIHSSLHLLHCAVKG